MWPVSLVADATDLPPTPSNERQDDVEEAGGDDDVEAGGFDDDLEAADDDLEGAFFDDDLVRSAWRLGLLGRALTLVVD